MEIAAVQRPGYALPGAPQAIPAQKLAENREVIQAVKALNAAELFGQNYELTFLMDRETQRPVIRLVDRKTKDVIRQVPPEYLLELTAHMTQAEE
jgi:flagellar protein FlaG